MYGSLGPENRWFYRISKYLFHDSTTFYIGEKVKALREHKKQTEHTGKLTIHYTRTMFFICQWKRAAVEVVTAHNHRISCFCVSERQLITQATRGDYGLCRTTTLLLTLSRIVSMCYIQCASYFIHRLNIKVTELCLCQLRHLEAKQTK